MATHVTKVADAYKAEIFIGGNPKDAKRCCVDFATRIAPVCVTVETVQYCYVDGTCEGVRVGLINYARFPKSQQEIWETAIALAHWLKQQLNQGSFTVQDHEQSLFFSTRPQDGCSND